MGSWKRTVFNVWLAAAVCGTAAAGEDPWPRADGFFPGQMVVTAAQDGAAVVVQWQLMGDRGVVGFHVFRSGGPDPDSRQINSEILYDPLEYGGRYEYRDVPPAAAADLTYQIEVVFADGSRGRSDPAALPYRPPARIPAAVAPLRFTATPSAVSDDLVRQAEVTARDIRQSLLARSQNTGARIKITVREEGIYRLDATTIAARFGAEVEEVREWIGRDLLRLSTQGVKCNWIPAAGHDGIFFYNSGYEDLYTFHNVFWLERESRGPQVPPLSGVPPGESFPPTNFVQTVRFEVQKTQQYQGLNMVELDDYWFWFKMQAPAQSNLVFELSRLDFGVSEANLNLRLQGGSSNSHHVQVLVNGTPVGEVFFTNLVSCVVDFPVATSALSNGINSLSLHAVRDPGVPASEVYLDHFSLTGRFHAEAVRDYLQLPPAETANQCVTGFSTSDILVAELLNSGRIRRLEAIRVDPGEAGSFAVSFLAATNGNAGHVVFTPAGALAPLLVEGVGASTLRATTNKVDYLMITHPILHEPVRQLESFWAGQIAGLQVRTVLIDEVYDEFSWGLKTPVAIRRFLAYAAEHWAAPAPKYVLLAGSSSIDYKNYLNYNGCLVPMVLTDTPLGPYSGDNLLADIAGDDGIPDFALGRIPAVNAGQMSNAVEKIRQHEDAANQPDVLRAFAFADDPDGAGDFPASCDAVCAVVPEDYEISRSYLYTPATNNAVMVRAATSNAFHAGTSLMIYFGHSAWNMLAGEGVFRQTDIPTLKNAPVFPIALLGTCWAARHEWPGRANLYFGNVFVLGTNKTTRAPNSVLAVWGPSGEAFNREHELMTLRFLGVHAADRTLPLGEVGRQAIHLAATEDGVRRFHVETMTLMGDPRATVW